MTAPLVVSDRRRHGRSLGLLLRCLLVSAPIGAALLTDTTPAKADLAGTVVDDATAVITQLIEDSIATQAVPNAARRIPAACYYFPSTIGAIEDKRYSALGKVLRKEVSDAAGYGVFEAIDKITALSADPTNAAPATALVDAVRTLQRQVLPKSTLHKLEATAPPAPPAAAAAPVAGVHTKTAAGLFINQKDPATGTPEPQRLCYFATKADAAQRASDIAYRNDDVETAIKKLPSSAAPASVAALQAALTNYGKASSPASASYAALKAAVVAAVAALGNNALSSAWTELATTVETPTVAESLATQQLRTCATKQTGDTEIACSVAALVRDAANGDDSLLTADVQRMETAWLAKINTTLGTAAKDANIAALVTAIGKGDAGGAQTAITAICGAIAPCNAALGLIPPLIAGQQAATLEQALSLTATLAISYKQAYPACQYCTLVADLATATDGVVKDLQSRDYGAAAGDTMDIVRQMACDPDPRSNATSDAGCKEGTDTLVYAFLRSLAVYSVDSATSGSTQTADADFRAAAVALIEEYGGQGVRRNLWAKAQWTYVPEFSLRDSWRPGLVLASPSSNVGNRLIVYPSMEMVRGRIRIPSRTLYLGLHGSLVDPLGPFVEVATRAGNNDNAGTMPGIVPLALVVPRAEFEIGLPDLSKNLVIGLGGAFRLFRSELTAQGDSRYCVLGSSDPNCNSGVRAGNFEFSVFAKFVP